MEPDYHQWKLTVIHSAELDYYQQNQLSPLSVESYYQQGDQTVSIGTTLHTVLSLEPDNYRLDQTIIGGTRLLLVELDYYRWNQTIIGGTRLLSVEPELSVEPDYYWWNLTIIGGA